MSCSITILDKWRVPPYDQGDPQPQPVPRPQNLSDKDKQDVDALDAIRLKFNNPYVKNSGKCLIHTIVDLLRKEFRHGELIPKGTKWSEQKTTEAVECYTEAILDAWAHELTVEESTRTKEENAKLEYMTSKRKEHVRIWRQMYQIAIAHLFKEYLVKKWKYS